MDLIEFTSPPEAAKCSQQQECLPSTSSSCQKESPTLNYSNPFDDILVKETSFFNMQMGCEIDGRPSLTGRESLGILNMSRLSFGGDEIFQKMCLNGAPSPVLDGKESLGILELSKLDLEKDLIEVPERLSLSNTRHTPEIVFSFNKPEDFPVSSPFEVDVSTEISKIYSVRSNDYLNEAFGNSLDWKVKSKLSSVASSLKSTASNESLSAIKTVEEEPKNDGFNDSVFIEANHLASKIANGSIYDESETDMLDDTAEPEAFSELEQLEEDEESKEPVKVTTEVVFKTIDKMLPPLLPAAINNLKIKRSSSFPTNESQTSNSSKNTTAIGENFAEISRKSSSGSTKSASDILSSLSNIFHSGRRRSEAERVEGKNLLSNLAEILLQDQSHNSLEDSGHSSIVDDVFNDADKKKDLPPAIEHEEVQTKLITKIPNKFKINKSVARQGPLKPLVPFAKAAGKSPLRTTPKKQEVDWHYQRAGTPVKDQKMKPVAQSTPTSSKIQPPRCISPLAKHSQTSFGSQSSLNKSNNESANSGQFRCNSSQFTKPQQSSFDSQSSLNKSNNESANSGNSRLFRCNSIGSKSQLKPVGRVRSSSIGSKTTGLNSVLGQVRRNLNNSLRNTSTEEGKLGNKKTVQTPGKENISSTKY